MITYTSVFSDGSLDRITITESFRRQSVMSSADRREQLLTEAGRGVDGDQFQLPSSQVKTVSDHQMKVDALS
ncbi:hypothetical protein [Absidia glauca]|uniref:Uncharacterized protein n=1 Tax=Absidia glauca TaxID=4829 RepID=A0A168NKU4_ABSGL|nr:hypothetical protein [Absidia glauca]